MRILGGPVKRIFGTVPTAGGEDWLFQRLHVADRPLYLSRLSDVRHSGAPAGFGIRLRIGAARPGETGQAEYRSLHLHVRPAAGDQSSGETRRLLLSVRPLDERLQEGDPEFVRSLGESRTGRVSRSLLETAGIDARNAFFGNHRPCLPAGSRRRGDAGERYSRCSLPGERGRGGGSQAAWRRSGFHARRYRRN
ncbi:hypothetical protein QW131_12640 [Roseibium salinum]|nr:hypothetical protein [Roseibium salinum]